MHIKNLFAYCFTWGASFNTLVDDIFSPFFFAVWFLNFGKMNCVLGCGWGWGIYESTSIEINGNYECQGNRWITVWRIILILFVAAFFVREAQSFFSAFYRVGAEFIFYDPFFSAVLTAWFVWSVILDANGEQWQWYWFICGFTEQQEWPFNR